MHVHKDKIYCTMIAMWYLFFWYSFLLINPLHWHRLAAAMWLVGVQNTTQNCTFSISPRALLSCRLALIFCQQSIRFDGLGLICFSPLFYFQGSPWHNLKRNGGQTDIGVNSGARGIFICSLIAPLGTVGKSSPRKKWGGLLVLARCT